LTGRRSAFLHRTMARVLLSVAGGQNVTGKKPEWIHNATGGNDVFVK
jgi:hypothetical protein